MAWSPWHREPSVVTLRPSDKTFEATRKDSILDQALEAGVPFPHSCTVGTCGSCKARLLSGKVRELMETAIILSTEELRAGYILACQSIAKTALELEVPALAETPDHPLVEMDTVIVDQRRLTHDIVELVVALPQPLSFTAGQYAELRHEAMTGPRAYSFALAPSRAPSDGATFYVRLTPDGEFTEWLFAQDRTGADLRLRGPFGNLWLRPNDSPILCVAGGSGLAPVKCLLEAAHDAGTKRDAILVFGARTSDDLYCVDELEELATGWATELRLVPVLSSEPEDSDWAGDRGMVTDAIARLDSEFLGSCDAYVCGPPPMVDAVEDQLCSTRGDAGFFHADRFLDKAFRGG